MLRIPVWSYMFLVAIFCIGGCGIISPTRPVKLDFYPYGPEYDRLCVVLSSSEAHIRVDNEQGIEWFDHVEKKWVSLEQIEDVKPLLEATQSKNFVVVFRRNSEMNNIGFHTSSIIEYADECGFSFTYVADFRAEGLHVHKAIPY